MFESLKKLDGELLLFINSHNNSFFDSFFYLTSNRWIWIPLYAFLLLLIIKTYYKKTWLILLLTAILVVVSDQLSSGLIKNIVMRVRPCHHLFIGPQLHLVNGECGGLYGFVSSHAANSFAIAVFAGLLLKKRFPNIFVALIIWASMVSFSRIYLGVHYPSDVLAGAMIGIGLAMANYKLFESIQMRKIKI